MIKELYVTLIPFPFLLGAIEQFTVWVHTTYSRRQHPSTDTFSYIYSSFIRFRQEMPFL